MATYYIFFNRKGCEFIRTVSTNYKRQISEILDGQAPMVSSFDTKRTRVLARVGPTVTADVWLKRVEKYGLEHDYDGLKPNPLINSGNLVVACSQCGADFGLYGSLDDEDYLELMALTHNTIPWRTPNSEADSEITNSKINFIGLILGDRAFPAAGTFW